MKIGMIGLGRMGANMARRLLRHGVGCVVFDLDPNNVAHLSAEGAEGAGSLEDLVHKLPAPRNFWLMVPAGAAVDDILDQLLPLLEPGDTLIDGGNTHYKDDVRRARAVADQGIFYVDVGTSGGVWGLERGYCLMIGGEDTPVTQLEPVFRALAPGRDDGAPLAHGRSCEAGYLHCGPSGSGHFVKMIHNGIEYGLMQAYAEGFDLLRGAESANLPEGYRYRLDLPDIAEVWRHGSVVGSWLLDLTALALAEDPQLSGFTGAVDDSGEGRWTVQASVEQGVPAPTITAALFTRFRSREQHTFGEKLLSAMRNQFGGHRERKGG